MSVSAALQTGARSRLGAKCLGDCSYIGLEFIAINVQLQLYNLCCMIMWPRRLLWVVAIAAVMEKQVLQRFSQEPFMKGNHVRGRSASG